MANTTCLRQVGPTTALSVGATSHAPVTISANGNDQCNFTAFLNTGPAAIAVNIANGSSGTAGAAVLPVDGTPQTVIVLPPLMTTPLVYATPPTPYTLTAIGSAAGPSMLYATPVGDQS